MRKYFNCNYLFLFTLNIDFQLFQDRAQAEVPPLFVKLAMAPLNSKQNNKHQQVFHFLRIRKITPKFQIYILNGATASLS